MFFGRDEAELRRLREKAYRQELMANIKQKQQQKTIPSVPQPRQQQPTYFMQQSQRQQQQRQQKRDKYLQELREQQQSEIRLKEERKKKEKQRDRLLDEKVRREAEILTKRQLQEIEKEKHKGRKEVVQLPITQQPQPAKKEQFIGRRFQQNLQTAKQQHPTNSNTPRKQEISGVTKFESLDVAQSIAQAFRPRIEQQQQNYRPVEERKYKPVYTEDFRRMKNTLDEEAYSMGQLKQKIQSSSRTTIDTGKYNNSLTELKNLNKLLQEKQQNYYRLPIMDSLDREVAVHSRDSRRQDPHEQEYSAFYEFKL